MTDITPEELAEEWCLENGRRYSICLGKNECRVYREVVDEKSEKGGQ